jgi:hypothetical protein
VSEIINTITAACIPYAFLPEFQRERNLQLLPKEKIQDYSLL